MASPYEEWMAKVRGFGGINPDEYAGAEGADQSAMVRLMRATDASRYLSPMTMKRLMARAGGIGLAQKLQSGSSGMIPGEEGEGYRPFKGDFLGDLLGTLGRGTLAGWAGGKLKGFVDRVRAGAGDAQESPGRLFSEYWTSNQPMLNAILGLGLQGPYGAYMRGKMAEEYANEQMLDPTDKQSGLGWLNLLLGRYRIPGVSGW